MALAWFREACRNGNIVSYLNVGELLSKGGNDLEPNMHFALGSYLIAYQNGALFL
jgi:TPR repeat protein